MRLRLALGAWSNKHFDHGLYPLRTLHAEYLPRYATVFDAAEADNLYHREPEPGELEAWCSQTPDGFVFLPKLHKSAVLAAPEGGLPEARLALERLAPLRAAGRLGPVLAQFPARFEFSDAGVAWLRELLDLAPAGGMAVELRHASWWRPEVRALLERRRAPLVWSTFPKAFAPDWVTGDVGYVRFVGKHTATRGRWVHKEDRVEDLLEIRARLAEEPWLECFVVVTNRWEGNAIDSLPAVAAALGLRDLAKRARRRPAEPLFPDPP